MSYDEAGLMDVADYMPGLLSDSQIDELQRLRIRRALPGEKVKDVTPDEYIIRKGGYGDDGQGVDDFDVVAFMNDAEDPVTGLVRDAKVDLRALPYAKNYFDFSVNLMREESVPWARQMWIGLMLFGEVCPICTTPKAFSIHNLPKDADVHRLAHSVTLLEHGVCPKCGKGKYELINHHGLKNYRSLVSCLGQRCVTGDTVIFTDSGMTTIGEVANRYAAVTPDADGFIPVSDVYVHNGEKLERASRVFIGKPERLLRVCFDDAPGITGTRDHPLLTPDGFIRLEDICADDYVAVAVGTHAYSDTVRNAASSAYAKNGYAEGEAFATRLGEADRLPEVIRRAPRIGVIRFLEAMFRTAGVFTKDAVELQGITHYSLFVELFAMLLNVGIVPRASANNTTIRVAGITSLERLRDVVCFRDERLTDLFNSGAAYRLADPYDYIPYNLWCEFCDWMDAVYDDLRYDGISSISSYSSYNEDRPSRIGMGRLLREVSVHKDNLSPKVAAQIAYFEFLANPKICWRAVSEVKELETPQVTYDFTMRITHRFVANGIINHNSGKSTSAVSYASYLVHQYLMFPNIAQLVPAMMKASSVLTGTMVSLNFAKAKTVLWMPFKQTIDNSSWFKDYFGLLDSVPGNNELYRVSSEYIAFRHRNIRLYPLGPTANTLRGDNRVLAMLDELGLFALPKNDNDDEPDANERANADGAYTSLFNSLATIQIAQTKLLAQGYNAAPPGLMMAVSSPYSQRDKMMRLLREAATDEGAKYMLGVNLPTWGMHPLINEDSPEMVMRKLANPEKFARDFGASPPLAHSRFITAEIPETSFSGKNSHIFTYQYDKSGELYGTVNQVRKVAYPSLVSIDAGVVNNSFVLTGGYYDFDTGKSVLTTVIECMPHEGLRINHNLMYQKVILPVCQQLNAIGLLADQWQSIDILNRAQEDMGKNPKGKPRLLARQYSPKIKDFHAAVGMLVQGSVVLPAINHTDYAAIMAGNIDNWRNELMNKPIAHMLLQFRTVRDVGPMRTPDKGEGFTDDIFRAFVLWAARLHDHTVMERLVEARDWQYENDRRNMAVSVFVGRGGRFLSRI